MRANGNRRYMMSKLKTIIKYGYLYNWYATQGTGNNSITSSDDWSVPANTDVSTLQSYLIANGFNYDSTTVGDKTAKSLADSLIWWYSSSVTGSIGNSDYPTKRNLSGFSGRGSGYRAQDGNFHPIQLFMYIWTKSCFNNNNLLPYSWQLSYLTTSMSLDWYSNYVKVGQSIRLFRSATLSEQLQLDGSSCTAYVGNDGLSYPTVKIGTQIWLACNLAETKFRGGTDIPNVTDNTAWSNSTTSVRCAYDNIEENVKIRQ
jgi:uncharacterized protein (TIGR02145 family)